MESHGCKIHPTYTVFCGDCGYAPTHRPITLGSMDAHGDVVLAFILGEDGDVIDYLGEDNSPETAITVAGYGTLVVLDSPTALASRPIVAAMHEATLRADCFGVTPPALPVSLDAALVGA
jgi:hypothetical protein